jgi:hypothetical protein
MQTIEHPMILDAIPSNRLLLPPPVDVLALFAGDSASRCRDHGYPEDADKRGGQRKLIEGAGQ